MISAENQLKYLNHRFIQRVFTTPEINLISSKRIDFLENKMLWSIWAAKEAAFKACQKQFTDIIFAHKEFSLNEKTLDGLIIHNLHERFTGILNYKSFNISLKWEWTQNTVHCIAVLKSNNCIFQDWNKIVQQIKSKQINLEVDLLKKNFTARELSSIFSEESLQSRYFAKKLLSLMGYSPSIEIIRLTFIKNNSTRLGPPILFLNDNYLSETEISLSHDGNWCASVIYDLNQKK